MPPAVVSYLRSLPAVRERSGQVFDLILEGKADHWDWDESRFPVVVDYCAAILEVSTQGRARGVPPTEGSISGEEDTARLGSENEEGTIASHCLDQHLFSLNSHLHIARRIAQVLTVARFWYQLRQDTSWVACLGSPTHPNLQLTAGATTLRRRRLTMIVSLLSYPTLPSPRTQ